MWRRTLVLRLAAALFLGSARSGTAQLLGGLKIPSPEKIAGKLADQHKKITKAIANQEGSKGVVGDTLKAAKNIGEQGTKTVKQALKSGVLQNVTAAAAAAAAAKPTAAPATTTTTTPAPAEHKSKVADAIQSVSDALEKAGATVNGSIAVQPKKAVKKLQDAIPKSLPEALAPKSLKKAKDGLEAAKKTMKSMESPEVKRVKDTGKDLASKVRDVLKGSHPKVVEAIEKTAPKIADTLQKSDPAKVQKVLKKTAPKVQDAIEKVPDMIKKDDPAEQEVPADGEEDESGSGWRWAVAGLALAGAGAGGWYLMGVIKGQGARSPTLLMEQEIGSWRGSGPQSAPRAGSTNEEPFFQQF